MPILSDQNLDLMLRELVNRPSLATVNASADPNVLKALWTALTFYQWTPSVQGGIDQTIQLAITRRDIGHHAMAVAQTRDAMMADPDFYPFCLSPRYWPDAQRSHFRGLVGETTYKPPAYWSSVGKDVIRMLAPVIVGTAVVALLPEEAVGGAIALAATRLAGKALSSSASKLAAKLATGSGLSVGGTAIANAFSGPSASDTAHTSEMWRRYQLEAKRRSMP